MKTSLQIHTGLVSGSGPSRGITGAAEGTRNYSDVMKKRKLPRLQISCIFLIKIKKRASSWRGQFDFHRLGNSDSLDAAEHETERAELLCVPGEKSRVMLN